MSYGQVYKSKKRKPKPYSAKGRKNRAEREAKLLNTIREKLNTIPDGSMQPYMDKMNAIIDSDLTKAHKSNTWKRRQKRK